jgi:hypothetical protein
MEQENKEISIRRRMAVTASHLMPNDAPLVCSGDIFTA